MSTTNSASPRNLAAGVAQRGDQPTASPSFMRWRAAHKQPLGLVLGILGVAGLGTSFLADFATRGRAISLRMLVIRDLADSFLRLLWAISEYYS